MHKEGTNPDNVQPTDILCDFCGTAWNEQIPVVEGHQGSCICGKCLHVAWDAVVTHKLNDAPPQTEEGAWACTMCLEPRKDPAFNSPIREEAFICRRCIRMAGHILDTDPDHDWSKPIPEDS